MGRGGPTPAATPRPTCARGGGAGRGRSAQTDGAPITLARVGRGGEISRRVRPPAGLRAEGGRGGPAPAGGEPGAPIAIAGIGGGLNPPSGSPPDRTARGGGRAGRGGPAEAVPLGLASVAGAGAGAAFATAGLAGGPGRVRELEALPGATRTLGSVVARALSFQDTAESGEARAPGHDLPAVNPLPGDQHRYESSCVRFCHVRVVPW